MEPLEQIDLKPRSNYIAETPQFPIARLRFSLTLLMIGFLLFILGLDPGLVGLDRGISIGFVQIVVLLIGLGVITWAAYLTLSNFWSKGEKSLLADFGSRTIATGYVICVFAALADAFGLGTDTLTNVYLGLLQSRGLMVGMGIIMLGFLMSVRWKFPTIQRPKAKRH